MSNSIKISDLVIDELYKNGIDTVFGVTGGAAVHFLTQQVNIHTCPHRLLKWNLTALSNHSKEDWKNILNKEGYAGDCYWWFTL